VARGNGLLIDLRYTDPPVVSRRPLGHRPERSARRGTARESGC